MEASGALFSKNLSVTGNRVSGTGPKNFFCDKTGCLSNPEGRGPLRSSCLVRQALNRVDAVGVQWSAGVSPALAARQPGWLSDLSGISCASSGGGSPASATGETPVLLGPADIAVRCDCIVRAKESKPLICTDRADKNRSIHCLAGSRQTLVLKLGSTSIRDGRSVLRRSGGGGCGHRCCRGGSRGYLVRRVRWAAPPCFPFAPSSSLCCSPCHPRSGRTMRSCGR